MAYIQILMVGVIATYARSEFDTVSLLQAEVETQVREKSGHSGVLQDDMTRDYKMTDSFKCEEDASHVAPADLTAPARTESDAAKATQTSLSAAGVTSDDPVGAGVLRSVLQLMIFFVIVDGMRRGHAQRQNRIEKEHAASSPHAQGEALAEATWLELVTAAAVGDEQNFEKALHAQPSLTRTDAWDCTPLHFAAKGGSAAIATRLLEGGAAFDALDANEETPLHFAARAGHAPICEKLLDAGANSDALNAQGMTPLVLAGLANQEPACRLLADRGASAGGMADEQLPPLVVSQLVRKVFAA